MLTLASTYDIPHSITELKSVGKTVCTVVGIVALVSANSTLLEMPPQMDIITPACISTNCVSDLRYNGNISVLWDGISIMTPEIVNSLLRLGEIEELQNDWNGNGASAFSKKLIDMARELVYSLSMQPVILPTGRDSIQMEYENSFGDYLEFELFESGQLKMFIYTCDGTAESKDISFAMANKAVCDFYGRII